METIDKMNRNNRTTIGTIENITSSKINIRLNNDIKSNLPIIDGVLYKIGLIGSFIKVPLGYTNLFGIVTSVGAAANPNLNNEIEQIDYSIQENRHWISAVLIGEQVSNLFERGITQYPTTGDVVHLVTNSDLRLIYGNYDESKSIVVGNISASENLSAYMNIDKLITRHSAFLGSTGSGKSNAISVILNSIISKTEFKSARIIVIDPHGEYVDAFPDRSQVYQISLEVKDSALYIPYWALPFDQLMSIISCDVTDSQLEYIREKICEKKQEYNSQKELGIAPLTITADSPIPFSIKQLWFELDNVERKTFADKEKITPALEQAGNPNTLEPNKYKAASTVNSPPYKNPEMKAITRFCDMLLNRLKDNRYNFLFHPGCYSVDSKNKIGNDLNHLLEGWIGGLKPISILDLSGVPPEIMQAILGTLLKIIYDALYWGQNLCVGGKQQPLLVVLEEAHIYLQGSNTEVSSKTLRNIVKEGRKFGIGLMLSTQRPSELDDTVLSQCGTLIALRMNNSRDRGHIQSAIQDELQVLIDLLPSLRTGEAIISGEAVQVPSRVKFYLSKYESKGNDPVPSEAWKIAKDNLVANYNKLTRMWRSQKLQEEEI